MSYIPTPQINGVNITCCNTPPTMFHPNSPPVIPQIMLPPNTNPAIVGAMATAVANKVNGLVSQGQVPHPGRYYLYNLVTTGGYNNQIFSTLVSNAIDILIYRLNSYTQEAIEQAALAAVQFEMAGHISTNQQFNQCLDQRILNEARNHYNESINVYRQIQAMKTGQPMQQTMYQQPGMYPGGGFPQMMMQPPVGMPNMTPLHSGAITSGNPMFAAPGVPIGTPVTAQPQAQQDSGKYSYLNTSAPSQQAQQTTHQQLSAAASVKNPVWRSSGLQAYPIAFKANSETYVLEPSIDPVTSKSCFVMKIVPITPTAQGDEMDRARHMTTVPVNTTVGEQTLEKLSESTAQAAEEKSIKAISGAIDSTVDSGDNIAIYDTLDSYLFDNRAKLYRNNKSKIQGKAVTSYGIVLKNIISSKNHRDLLLRLANCKTFANLSAIINQTLNDSKNTAAYPDISSFISELDEFLADEFTSFLQTRLSFSLRIDSFIEDSATVIPYLDKKYGETYSKAVASNQETFIAGVFAKTYLSDEYNELIMEGEHAEDIEFITSIPQAVSVTTIGVTSKELNIGVLEGHGNLITSKRFPALANFVDALFKSVKNWPAGFAHHYIETSDRVLYEVNEGIIGNSVILITKK